MDASSSEQAFAHFVRDHRAEVLAEWERRVRALPPAAELDTKALIDHLPMILDDIAASVDAAHDGDGKPRVGNDPDRHALTRLGQGYDLGQVVTEYSLLRETILELSARQPHAYPDGLRIFNRILDDAIARAVDRYSQASQRMLRALDRISMLAFGNSTMDELLHTLLEVMLQASPAVDEATILLLDGDRLHVRASVGITSERDADFSIALGEGFSGGIAARRQPAFVRSAETDPQVVSPFLRERGIKALYGVPIIDADDVIGVAHMGSRTAHEFHDEDLLLFRAMVNRASHLITETRLKHALAARADELKLVLDAAAIGAWSWDLGSDKLTWDERTRALFGVGDEPITYARFVEAVAADDRERVAEAIERAIAGQSAYRIRFRVVRSDGEERHVEARGAVLRENGAPARFIGTIEDRTSDEYAERERELFLAALGHDLRSPLNAIMMASTNLIHHADLVEPVARTVARIARSSERMARLIEQLLDFARARAGYPIQLAPRRVDLAELWQHVLDELGLSVPDRRIVLRASGDTTGEWDPDRLLQVFQNLASNAVQYGDPTQPITISTTDEGERVCSDVHNRGAPIPAELLPVLFDPFRRGVRGRGLGLGLYIAQEIVKAHGGRIEARSSAEEGTRFRVILPRRRAATA
jgi:PAS domain S-box-containing protein